MKKVWLTLGLILILLTVGGQGYQIFKDGPAFGQPPPYPPYGPPPSYFNPYGYPQPYNYYNYYSAPYSDPLSQFLYYVVPQRSGEQERDEWEHREREFYKHRGRGREGFEPPGHERR